MTAAVVTEDFEKSLGGSDQVPIIQMGLLLSIVFYGVVTFLHHYWHHYQQVWKMTHFLSSTPNDFEFYYWYTNPGEIRIIHGHFGTWLDGSFISKIVPLNCRNRENHRKMAGWRFCHQIVKNWKISQKKDELKQSTTHVGDVAVENLVPLEEVRDDHLIEEEGFLIELNEILERHAVIADKGSLGLENVYQGESITNNGLKLACKFCGEGFRKKYKLQLHVDVVHENMREHRCKDCGYKADRVDSLRRHIVGLHRTRQWT